MFPDIARDDVFRLETKRLWLRWPALTAVFACLALLVWSPWRPQLELGRLELTAIDVGTLILTESALSFLGLGISPPTPSWGNMLTRAAQDLSRGPWLVYAPGAAIFLTVLCLYLLGDGLRDALDPRLNQPD